MASGEWRVASGLCEENNLTAETQRITRAKNLCALCAFALNAFLTAETQRITRAKNLCALGAFAVKNNSTAALRSLTLFGTYLAKNTNKWGFCNIFTQNPICLCSGRLNPISYLGKTNRVDCPSLSVAQGKWVKRIR
jgi:hypothetical protein